jgi:hypothetical protein
MAQRRQKVRDKPADKAIEALRAERREPRTLSMPDALPAALPHSLMRAPCAVCGRQARETCHWASLVWPCCSAECVAATSNAITSAISGFLTTQIEGLGVLTYMEKEAISEARRPLYEALIELGIADAFNDCTAEQIDRLIETIWNALRASMQRQSARGEIPI